MSAATITSKGRITIPKDVRDALGVRPGDRVKFVAHENGVYKMVAATRDVTQLKGLATKASRPASLAAMKKAITRGASGR